MATYTGSRSETSILIRLYHHPILGIVFLQNFDILIDKTTILTALS